MLDERFVKNYHFDKQGKGGRQQRWILKRKVLMSEGGGMQLTEDNVQWPCFSISGVLILQCYSFQSWILHLFTAEIILDTPVLELNSSPNFCFRSYTTILTEIQLAISQKKHADGKMRPTCQVLISFTSSKEHTTRNSGQSCIRANASSAVVRRVVLHRSGQTNVTCALASCCCHVSLHYGHLPPSVATVHSSTVFLLRVDSCYSYGQYKSFPFFGIS